MPINMFFIVKNRWEPYFTDKSRIKHFKNYSLYNFFLTVHTTLHVSANMTIIKRLNLSLVGNCRVSIIVVPTIQFVVPYVRQCFA
jgi:hypothetical protein